MFGDATASGRDDQRGEGADVEGACAVTTGADYVDDVVPGADARSRFAHYFGQAGDLLGRFAFHAQGDGESRNL